MSCNGNNHKPGCKCGWGGVFYGLGIGLGENYWGRSESYTNPNARCPNCFARVYFYRSPDGGSVYFDDLGPPWPKHPCMDTGKKPFLHGKTRSALERPLWATDGWHPMQCDSIEAHKVYSDIAVLVNGEGRDRREVFLRKPLAKISQYSPILWRRFEGQRGHYEISTLDLSDSGFKEVRLEAFDNIENIKKIIVEERLAAEIKIFDDRMVRLKKELINGIYINNLEVKLNDEILKFKRNLIDYGDLEENTKRATEFLKICVQKAVKSREIALLAQSIYDELVAEGSRLEDEFSEFGIDLRPELRKARKKAVIHGLSLDKGKAMLRDVATSIVEKEIQARSKARIALEIEARLLEESLKIEKEFEKFGVDLSHYLHNARKDAISRELSLEEGKSFIWEEVKRNFDLIKKSHQKNKNIQEIRNFIDEICLTSNEFHGKGRVLLENALEDSIRSGDIDVSVMKDNLLNMAMLYLEKVVEAWELHKNNKKSEGRVRKSEHVIHSKNGRGEEGFDGSIRRISRAPFNSILADKLRLALANSENK